MAGVWPCSAALAGAALLVAAAAVAPTAQAAGPQPVAEATVTGIRQAIDEERYRDAERDLAGALLTGARDPRLTLLSADLDLRQGRLIEALDAYREAGRTPSLAGRALEGQGVVLVLLGRMNDAEPALRGALAQGGGWRSWNALGAVCDASGRWAEAEAAYARALETSDRPALVFNNRGYSRLLQRRLDEAVADFTDALRRKPDLAEARDNLRLARAMKGEYEEALRAGPAEDHAVLLNNAGVAATTRGDWAQAQDLLSRAMTERGSYYALAARNLAQVRAHQAQQGSPNVSR